MWSSVVVFLVVHVLVRVPAVFSVVLSVHVLVFVFSDSLIADCSRFDFAAVVICGVLVVLFLGMFAL